jgi:hypothetical protein
VEAGYALGAHNIMMANSSFGEGPGGELRSVEGKP